MGKKILVALPVGLLQLVDSIAEAEHRNRSDLIREALRRYADSYRRNNAHLQLVDVNNPLPSSEPGGRSAADTFADPRSAIKPKSDYEYSQARQRFFSEPAHPGIPQGISGNRGDYRPSELDYSVPVAD